jgi:hypothetical protein
MITMNGCKIGWGCVKRINESTLNVASSRLKFNYKKPVPEFEMSECEEKVLHNMPADF